MKEQPDVESTQYLTNDFFAAASLQNRNPELLESWRRSQLSLGSPDKVTDVPQVAEDQLEHYLLDMFQAPLDHFADSLHDTGLGLLLADSRGHILQRWTPDRGASAHFDRVGTMPRSILSEGAVGTNGVGTVIATGKPIQIHSSEHFAEFYRGAICTGTPIRHPISGRLMAVVTLSSDVTPRSDLLRPLISSLSFQLEHHATELSQPTTRRMFDFFRSLSRRSHNPVIAVGSDDVYVQSSSVGRLNTEDVAEIRRICSLNYPTGRYAVELSTGTTLLDLTAFGEGNNVIMVLEDSVKPRVLPHAAAPTRPLAGRSAGWLAATHQVAKLRDMGAIALIIGEAGVGKTSLALGHPSHSGDAKPGRPVLDAAASHVLGSQEWLQMMRSQVSSNSLTVIQGIETLLPPVLDGLRSLLESSDHVGPVLLTAMGRHPKDAEELRRKFGVPSVWVPPLRDRLGDIPQLWNAFVRDAAPAGRLEPTPSAVEVLRDYPWPGNTKELKMLINQLILLGRSGTVGPEDLPGEFQSGRALTRLERVEVEAIQKALSESQGNRSKAADALGISRATVYRKMKAYKLTV